MLQTITGTFKYWTACNNPTIWARRGTLSPAPLPWMWLRSSRPYLDRKRRRFNIKMELTSKRPAWSCNLFKIKVESVNWSTHQCRKPTAKEKKVQRFNNKDCCTHVRTLKIFHSENPIVARVCSPFLPKITKTNKELNKYITYSQLTDRQQQHGRFLLFLSPTKNKKQTQQNKRRQQQEQKIRRGERFVFGGTINRFELASVKKLRPNATSAAVAVFGPKCLWRQIATQTEICNNIISVLHWKLLLFWTMDWSLIAAASHYFNNREVGSRTALCVWLRSLLIADWEKGKEKEREVSHRTIFGAFVFVSQFETKGYRISFTSLQVNKVTRAERTQRSQRANI